MIKLGQKVRDNVTGFEGVAIGITKWLNGCTTIGIKAKVKEDGTVIDSQWVDEPQVEIINESESAQKKDTKVNGGPLLSAPRRNIRPQ